MLKFLVEMSKKNKAKTEGREVAAVAEKLKS